MNCCKRSPHSNGAEHGQRRRCRDWRCRVASHAITPLPPAQNLAKTPPRGGNAKAAGSNWTAHHEIRSPAEFALREQNARRGTSSASGDRWRISLDGEPVEADAVEIAPNTLSILLRGESHEIRIARAPDGKLNIQTGLREFTAEVSDPRSWRGRRLSHVEVEGRQQIAAPMAGKVVRLLVKVRRPGGGRPGPAGRGSHENAKRNPLPEIRHRGTLTRQRRPTCKRGGSTGLDQLENSQHR